MFQLHPDPRSVSFGWRWLFLSRWSVFFFFIIIRIRLCSECPRPSHGIGVQCPKNRELWRSLRSMSRWLNCDRWKVRSFKENKNNSNTYETLLQKMKQIKLCTWLVSFEVVIWTKVKAQFRICSISYWSSFIIAWPNIEVNYILFKRCSINNEDLTEIKEALLSPPRMSTHVSDLVHTINHAKHCPVNMEWGTRWT